MSGDDIYKKPLSFSDLQLFKALTPLAPKELEDLERIERLDIADFSEQEIRSYVIDPIVRILGYEKGTDFSVGLGKRIKFLDKNKFPDYKLNLWQENFWLIEAKRPGSTDSFGYADLAQAIEYAIHPEINAALVVLCDGRKIEVFDREVSVTEPVLHIRQEHLTRDFDKLRHLLEPWQVWFFQKRRIVRLIDKVFDKEFNLQRIEEFRSLIERRLIAKRGIVLDNFRRNVKSDAEEQERHIRSAPIEELVNVHFFIEHNHRETDILVDTLVARSEPNSFKVLYKIFPDHPRDANDTYFGHALAYLMALSEKHATVNWLPSWLAPSGQSHANLEAAVQLLLKQCLSYFEDDEARRAVLLTAAAFRRISKLLILSNEAEWRMGEALHFLERYQGPELSWSQIVASPERHLIGSMDALTVVATHQFVIQCRSERGEFKSEVAKLRLKELWKLERELLKSIGNYPKLRKERNLGELRMTEAADVTYDGLGHLTLCLMARFSRWTAYALKQHRPLIETLASLGSWKAHELLGDELNKQLAPVTSIELAERFFCGDVSNLEALRAGYAGLV